MGDKTVKALAIIRDVCVESPRQFARLMWPDSEAWSHSQRVGRNLNGSQRGAGMSKCGGSFLGKLRKAGLVAQLDHRYILTQKGKEMVEHDYKVSAQGVFPKPLSAFAPEQK